MKIIVFFLVLILFTGCSDIDYPPRAITPGVTGEAPEPKREPRKEVENKYRLRKHDLTPRTFNWESEPAQPYLISAAGDNSFSVSIEFNSPQHYSFAIVANGDAVVTLSGADEVYGAFYVSVQEDEEDGEYSVSPVYFPQGLTQLTFTAIRGAVRIDKITVVNTPPVSAEMFRTSGKPIHPDPSDEAAEVFGYLTSMYGGRTLTAQICGAGSFAEIEAVFEATGRYPAVRWGELHGVDGYEEELRAAVEWWREYGGIVGLSWFPKRESESELYEDAEQLASILRQLELDGIPVLFNPLPDGGSRLYWYGKSGGEEYIRLYRLVYERFIFHGLDNLIWVWSGGDYKYYPGDNRVDIIGESVFVRGNVGSQAVRFANTAKYGAGRKPAIVAASSAVPSADVLGRDNAGWLMWTLGNGEIVKETEKDALERFFNHELSICLDNLPIFG
jgi:mannan endo-1,4-beta-mannosidase